MANEFVKSPTASFAPKDPLDFLNPVKNFLAKPETSTKSSGGSSASKKALVAPLPDDTKLYQDLNVTTGVGGYGEGQTVDTIQKGIKTRAYRPELIKELQDTKQFGDDVLNSPNAFPAKMAKKEDKSLFTSTEGLNLESTVGQIKLAKAKALGDVQDFLFNPESKIASTFKKNIGVDKYNNYKAIVDNFNVLKEAIKSDTSFVDEERGIRGIRTLAPIKAAIDIMSPTGKDYSTYLAAIDAAKEDGAKPIEDWTTPTANFLGGALMYGGASSIGRSVLTKGLSEMGFAIEGTTGGNMVKLANTIERTSNKAPTLYAATVDNALTNAMEYGVTKSLNGDYSSSDFVNNMLIGATVPVIFKGAGVAYDKVKGMVKGVTPKDVVELEKAVKTHMQTQGSTTVKEAMDGIADSHIFSDGETLATKIDNYKAETPKNSDSVITHPEVQSTFASQGKSISARAAKKVANVITKLNEKIKGENTAEGGYGALGDEDKVQLVKQSVMDNLAGETGINSDVAEKAIKKAFDDNGMKYNDGEYGTINESADDLDEMFHTPASNPEAIPDAKTVSDLGGAIEGKAPITMRNIDDARFDVDNLNRAGAKRTKELADEAGVKFDWDKAVDAEGKTNKPYLHKVLDDIEVTTSGYGKFAQKVSSAVKRTIGSIEANIKKATKFDAIGLGKEALDNIKTIKGEVSALTKRLKSATKQVEKNAIKAAIAKKNIQIETIKAKGKEKLSEISVIRTLVRGEIDAGSTQYRNLPNGVITAAKNKYKAMVSSATSLKRAGEIVEKFHQEMYKKSIRANEAMADTLITKVLKAARSKTKKSIVTKDTIEEMMEFYKKFSSAKVDGDLTKMQEAVDNLKSVYEIGRSEFKANIEKAKADTRNIGNEVINELAANADGEFRMRNVNTPEAGTPMEKDMPQNLGIFIEGMVGTHLQFAKIFGENSIITKIFYKPFLNAQSQTELIKIDLFKKLAEVKEGMRGHISGSHDSMMAKYTLWRNSKSAWGKGGVNTAAEYNLNNDMVFSKDKSGKWQYIPIGDIPKFKQKNADKFADGTYVHFWDNSPKKEEILNSVYAEFDNAYKNSPKFKAGEDYFRTHYDNQGKKNGGLMQRLYNKPFEAVTNYNPIAMWRKSSRDELVGTNGNLDNYYRESVDVSHTLSRTGPGEKVRMVLDPTEILTRHVHGAVYWGNVIEPLRNAQALLNVLKRGKSFLANPLNIDASIQRDLGTVGDDVFKTIPNVDGDVERIGIGDRILSDEAVNFLETNLEKYATQGGNLGMKIQLGQDAIFTRLLSRTYQSLLTGVKTPFKQAMSLFDIFTATGEKNSLSAMRGVKNLDNIKLMLEESGIFAERVPNAISKSELGRTLRFDSSRTMFARAQDATEYIGSAIMGNMIKAFDGFSSANAFLAGVSRYLDRVYPELHVAGRNLNLEDIKAKLIKTDELGNIIDDSEWRQVVTEGEIMMSKIMGSNAAVDTPLAAKGILGKVTGFMGKSAINRMVSMWDTVIRGSLNKNLSSDSYKATDKIVNVARFTLAGIMMQAYVTWINKQKDRLDVAIGAKAQGDIDIRNEEDAKSYMDEVSLIIDSQFFMPSVGVEIFKSFDPVVKYVTNFNKLQTSERKIQEGAEAGLQTLFPLHNDIYNVIKYGATISSKMDFTNVGEKEFDKAATSVASQYGGNKSATDYSPENDKWNGLSSVEQKILISKQIEFDKVSAEKANIEKPIKELQDKFVKDAVKKYGKNITPQQVYDEAVANPEFAKTIEIKELESYYTKIQSAGAKTTGEKDSILMGKSTEAIFDVEIKPMMENGKAGDAFERVKEMRMKNIIKSDNGVINMIKLMKEFQDANKAQ